MKKYQIYECGKEYNHAGSKATADFQRVAAEKGYQTVNVRMVSDIDSFSEKVKRQIRWFADWKNVYKTIEENSVVLLQCPFHHNQINRETILKKLKEKKHVKFICAVHDIEKLRAFRYNDYYEREFAFMLEIADVLIVHNEKMKKYLAGCGFPENKMVILEIFDYLNDKENIPAEFERSITIAGNLDTKKCGYIKELPQLCNTEINLYGPNFDHSLKTAENIHYHGSLPSGEIPFHLNKGFGVVWEGSSIHGCTGDSGQYLRYNNPHKLSLYLSSGLPVIIWKDAAEASFVQKYGVGITVGDLIQFDRIVRDINLTEYNEISLNVLQMAEKLKKGYFAGKALDSAELILKEGS